jgi:hypothetical protein
MDSSTRCGATQGPSTATMMSRAAGVTITAARRFLMPCPSWTSW